MNFYSGPNAEKLAETDVRLSKVYAMRDQFELDNDICHARLERKDIFLGWEDPLEPNYFIAYCRMAKEIDLQIASAFQKVHWLLDDVNAWREAINGHSPFPPEFELCCLDEIELERNALMEIVSLLGGEQYWDDYSLL